MWTLVASMGDCGWLGAVGVELAATIANGDAAWEAANTTIAVVGACNMLEDFGGSHLGTILNSFSRRLER